MPLTRQQKEEVVQQMTDHVSSASSVVFFSYSGLNVQDSGELRDKLFEAGCGMRVMPKRLLKLVLQSAKLDFDAISQEGQLAVVWGSDAVSPAKILYEFAKGKENIHLLAGALEHEMVTLDQVKNLAQLPSREQLLGQLVGVLAGPMRGLVGVLSGVPRQMVYVLQAVKDQKSGQ